MLPLFWGKKGNRAVDSAVRCALKRTEFPTPSGTVQQVNSLRGACLVQGVLLARYLRDWKPVLPITEAHPKALRHLLLHSGQPEMTKLARLTEGLEDREDERDATLSAIGAWAMYKRLPGWRDLYREEPNPLQPVRHARSLLDANSNGDARYSATLSMRRGFPDVDGQRRQRARRYELQLFERVGVRDADVVDARQRLGVDERPGPRV